MKQIVYAVIFIVRQAGRDHEFLMAQRAPGKYMGGTWQLISGGQEAGETVWQTAIREVGEETGLVVIELYRLSHLTQFYRPDNDSLCTGPMFCAFVKENAQVVINHENTNFHWIPRAETRSRLMWPGDREAFDEVCSEILDDGPTKPYLRIEI